MAQRGRRALTPHRRTPTPAELEAARDAGVPDVIGPKLDVLFVGINPSLYSAAVGHHFARPGNRFWPTLHRAGFTGRQLAPDEEDLLLKAGCGISNVVRRATASAAELRPEEFIAGGRRLLRLLRRYRPRVVAVLGIGAYRSAFGARRVRPGRQMERLGETVLWVLPNPSGLNANYQLPELVRLFRRLRKEAVGIRGRGRQRT